MGIRRGTGPGECHSRPSKAALGGGTQPKWQREVHKSGWWVDTTDVCLPLRSYNPYHSLANRCMVAPNWTATGLGVSHPWSFLHTLFLKAVTGAEHLSLVSNNVLKSVGCQWHACVKGLVLIDTALGERGSLEVVPWDPSGITMIAGARSCN